MKCILRNEMPQFCSLNQHYLEPESKHLSPRLYPAEAAVPSQTEPPLPLHFKNIWLSVLADLVIRLVVGVISEPPLGVVFFFLDMLTPSISNVALLSLCSQTQPLARHGHQR